MKHIVYTCLIMIALQASIAFVAIVALDAYEYETTGRCTGCLILTRHR